MEIDKLPFSVFRKLDDMTSTASEKDNRLVIYHNDSFANEMIKYGFLELIEAPVNAQYKFYKITENFTRLTHAEVLHLITGYTITDIMKKKVISITDVPYDYFGLFEALEECDGYFNKVDMGNGAFRKALDFHGFARGAGVNGHYSTGTEKLTKYVNNGDEEKIIEIITGKTKEENEKILEADTKTQEIKKMKELAEKYGYNVLSDEELELAYEYKG